MKRVRVLYNIVRVMERGEELSRISNYLFAGAVAGAVSRTATAPLDRLKVILQVQTTYMTALQGIKQIYKETGLSGYYVGNGVNVLKAVPESGIRFCAFEKLKKLAARIEGKDEPGTFGRLLAGGAAGAISLTSIYPLEVLKTRLQVLPGKASMITLARDIYVKEGVSALYRGLVPSLTGIIPLAAIEFATYEALKKGSRSLLPPGSEQKPWMHMACGTVAGAVAATSVYPLQLIRTRLQAQPLMYEGMVDAFKTIVNIEGVQGLYKGLGPSMWKIIPAAAITYTVYEQMKKSLF